VSGRVTYNDFTPTMTTLTYLPLSADATALYDHVHSGAGTSASAHASVPGFVHNPRRCGGGARTSPSWHQVKLPVQCPHLVRRAQRVAQHSGRCTGRPAA
jgi:hypothetical protein